MGNSINNNNTTKRSSLTLLGFALGFFILDRLWGFVYSHTVYSSVVITYVVFITLLLLFLRVGAQYKFGRRTKLSTWWTPYLVYTLIGFFLRFTLQSFTYWLCCFILIMIAARCFLLKELPLKILFWSGLFALVGVFVQLFFPVFYSAYINPLFLREELIALWSEGYGLNGFTYQLGTTASIILIGELVLVCMRDSVTNMINRKHKLFYYGMILLFVIGVFLTGKRTLSILAVVIPLIVYYLRQKSLEGRMFYIIIVSVAIIIILEYFFRNVVNLEDTRMFSRFAVTYEDSRMGEDVSSGRSALYDMAIKGFKSSPVFGIGVGRFIQYSGADTDVHNTYLQVLCEQGIVGLVLYIFPILVSLFYTFKLYRRISENLKSYLLLSISFQLMHVFNAITENCNMGESFIMYFLAIAIVISIDNQYKYNPAI